MQITDNTEINSFKIPQPLQTQNSTRYTCTQYLYTGLRRPSVSLVPISRRTLSQTYTRSAAVPVIKSTCNISLRRSCLRTAHHPTQPTAWLYRIENQASCMGPGTVAENRRSPYVGRLSLVLAINHQAGWSAVKSENRRYKVRRIRNVIMLCDYCCCWCTGGLLFAVGWRVSC